MVICLPFIHSVQDGHMKKVKVNENFQEPITAKIDRTNIQKKKRKAPAFVGGAINKWGDLAAYTPETQKRRKIVNKTEEQLW